MPKTAIALILIILICTHGALGKEVEGSVLQYKLNRLYFSSGLEDFIYPDCKFVVYRGRVVLSYGLIEFSQPGVSVSYPLDHPFEGKNLERLKVLIDAVDVDTLAPIQIGAAEFKSLPTSTDFPTRDFPPLHVIYTLHPVSNMFMTNSGSQLNFMLYESLFEMALDFSGGGLDGFFSYGKPRSPAEGAASISTPANYYAALIPNISRDFNHGGMLTTALYYRFDPDKSYVYFTGDSVTPQTQLYACDSTGRRAYDHNPEDGRRLIQSVRNRPDHLALAVFDSQLQQTGAYFADILSRDKVRTRLTSDWYEGDLYLCFVPLDPNNALRSLKYIYDITSSDTIPDRQINQTIAIIGKYIESAENAASEQIRNYYIGKIDRSFKEDIGVFPLYRPTIYFVANHNLQGYMFDPDGYMDLKMLSKIMRPEIPER